MLWAMVKEVTILMISLKRLTTISATRKHVVVAEEDVLDAHLKEPPEPLGQAVLCLRAGGLVAGDVFEVILVVGKGRFIIFAAAGKDAEHRVPFGEFVEKAEGDRDNRRWLVKRAEEVEVNQAVGRVKIDARDHAAHVGRPDEAFEFAQISRIVVVADRQADVLTKILGDLWHVGV